MHARLVALGLPLVVLGAAGCRTGGTQSEGRPTASAPGGSGSTATAPTVRPGSPHADDQILAGRIASVSGRSISIESSSGETRVLELAPETLIRVDGRDATHAQLREGQPVRASFSEVEGRSVAVEVQAGSERARVERASPYGPAPPTPPPADAYPR